MLEQLYEAEFWVAIAFVIFVIILVRLGVHRTVAQALDDRAKRIAAELDEARRLREEAQAILTASEKKRREAEQEAQGIIEGARSEAERVAQEAKAKAEDFVVRRTQMAEQKIAQAESQAVAEVRAAAAEAAVAASERILGTDRARQGRRRPDQPGHPRREDEAELALLAARRAARVYPGGFLGGFAFGGGFLGCSGGSPLGSKPI